MLDDRDERAGFHGSKKRGRRFAPFARFHHRWVHFGLEPNGDRPTDLRERPAGGIADDEEVDVLRRWACSAEVPLRPGAEDEGRDDSLDICESMLEQRNSSKRLPQQRFEFWVERRFPVRPDDAGRADALAHQKPCLLEPLCLTLDGGGVEPERASELAEGGFVIAQEQPGEERSLTLRTKEWKQWGSTCAYNASHCA